MRHDLIVVGAGTAGCMAAKTAAERDLSVLLIDSKLKDEIGDKACANAASAQDLGRVGLKHPREIHRVLRGVKYFSPDRKTVFTIDLKQEFVLDRRAFGQRLLNDAIRAGAELSDQTKALGPVMEKGKVVGIKTAKEKMLSKLVVDASGFQAVIRNKLPGAERVRREDTGFAYLEIREVGGQVDPNYFLAYTMGMGKGYWVVPERGNRANMGIIVPGAPNHPSPKALFYEHVFPRLHLEDSKLIKARSGAVPMRGPINPLYSNGVMFVGDAGCQTNPFSGGGIGLSLAAGKIAGEVAADAIEMETDLKEYHRRYMDAYGNHQVALDAIRKLSREITGGDINYLMHSGVVTREDLEKVTLGIRVELSAPEKAKRFLRGIRRPRLIWAFLKTLGYQGRLQRRFPKILSISSSYLSMNSNRRVPMTTHPPTMTMKGSAIAYSQKPNT